MRWAWVVMCLLLTAVYTPGRTLFGNLDKFPHPERLAMIVAVYLILGLIWYGVIAKLGISGEAGLVSALAFSLMVTTGAGLAMVISTLGAVVVVLLVALALAIVLDRFPADLSRMLTLGTVGFMVVGLALAWDPPASGSVESFDVDRRAPIPSGLSQHPDVFVVVLDGLPGQRALREVYGHQLDLGHHPDVVRPEAWASYPMTVASLASLLEMGYPVGAGEVVDESVKGQLAHLMAGHNRISEFLASEGYRITYVESGYSRSYCLQSVDVCVPSPFLDEGTFWALGQSVIAVELRERQGHAFSQGAIHTMDWLETNLPRLAENRVSDFVFANVLAPHPPLLLDSNCQLQRDDRGRGGSVPAGEWAATTRRDAFLAQAQCVAGFEDRIFAAVGGDAVVLVLSDHGGDSRGQMSDTGGDWDRADVVERLNVHMAIRAPSCRFVQEVVLPEVLNDVLWCLAGSISEGRNDPSLYSAHRIEATFDYELKELSPGEAKAARALDGAG